jgi:hypothetical protein
MSEADAQARPTLILATTTSTSMKRASNTPMEPLAGVPTRVEHTNMEAMQNAP